MNNIIITIHRQRRFSVPFERRCAKPINYQPIKFNWINNWQMHSMKTRMFSIQRNWMSARCVETRPFSACVIFLFLQFCFSIIRDLSLIGKPNRITGSQQTPDDEMINAILRIVCNVALAVDCADFASIQSSSHSLVCCWLSDEVKWNFSVETHISNINQLYWIVFPSFYPFDHFGWPEPTDTLAHTNTPIQQHQKHIHTHNKR